MQCPWRNLWRRTPQTSRRSITLAVVDIICRHAASAGRTAHPATNASGVVVEIGKLVVSGENARQDENGASEEHGNANASGEEAAMITANIAGNVLRRRDTRAQPGGGPCHHASRVL